MLALNEGFENLFMSIMLDRERAVRAKEVTRALLLGR
jgi:hypothetical protein